MTDPTRKTFSVQFDELGMEEQLSYAHRWIAFAGRIVSPPKIVVARTLKVTETVGQGLAVQDD